MRLLRTLAPVTCVLAMLVLRPAPFAAFFVGAGRTVHRLADENVICRIYLDPHDKFTRVVAPVQGALTLSGGVALPQAILSNITVNYTGFGANPAAQAAFQAAVDILAGLGERWGQAVALGGLAPWWDLDIAATLTLTPW